MNKPIIITVAIVILLLAGASWLYLFMYGAPQSTNEVFTDLGVLPTPTNTLAPAPVIDNEPSSPPSTEGAPLQQLTLRPTAGFWVGASVVRFIEQGTGHLYEIDPNSGNEVRLSNTSIPVVTTATFGPTGTTMVLTSERVDGVRNYLATYADDRLTTIDLPPDGNNFFFTSSSSLLYTRDTGQETVGYQYDLTTNTQAEVFRTPLRQITVAATEETYLVAPAPATALEGIVVDVSGSESTILGTSAFGLTVAANETWLSRSFVTAGELRSTITDRASGAVYQSPVVVVPEKCAFTASVVYCAAPIDAMGPSYIEDWYQGTLRSQDALWVITPRQEQAQLLVSPQTTIGRPLDIRDLVVGQEGRVFFTNRLGNSLWMYAPSNR